MLFKYRISRIIRLVQYVTFATSAEVHIVSIDDKGQILLIPPEICS